MGCASQQCAQCKPYWHTHHRDRAQEHRAVDDEGHRDDVACRDDPPASRRLVNVVAGSHAPVLAAEAEGGGGIRTPDAPRSDSSHDEPTDVAAASVNAYTA